MQTKSKIFTVFDTKAGAYMQPFFSESTGTAIRSFTAAANNQEHDFCKHAEDFVLFELGSYDCLSATITMLPAPHALNVASELKKS